MADDSLELIRLRNNFYRDNYRRVMKILLLLSVFCIVLIVAIFYLIAHRPTPKYFATTQSGRVLQLVPNNAPLYNSASLLQWASKIAAATYTLNFANYRAQLQSLQPYFTNSAWQQFLTSWQDSGNLEALDKRQMVTNAVVAGAPVVLHEGLIDGQRYAWRVQVPLHVTFKTSSDEFSGNYLITMVIVRVSTLENENGIAIAQYIV